MKLSEKNHDPLSVSAFLSGYMYVMRHTHVIVLVIVAAIVTGLLLYVNSNIALAQSELSKEQLDAIIFGNGTTPPAPEGEESSNQNAIYENRGWHYKLPYPSNLTKYPLGTLNLATITGHGSITDVGFGLPDKNQTFFTIASARQPGNFLLRDYVTEEIMLLNRLVGYKQLESSPSTIGGNPAHKIVYSLSSVQNGVEVAQAKVMEIVTINNVETFFIEYATLANDYEKYPPIAQKMIDSFRFTGSIMQ
jgi:hypothetical protein